MGDRTNDRQPAAWQGTLAQMRDAGTLVFQACIACGRSTDVDLTKFAEKFGDSFELWNRRPVCPLCGKLGHYMASPGPGTPFRPMRTGVEAAVRREVFLRSFKFTRRDKLRIKALAERVKPNWSPDPLRDLDVPFVVGACWPGQEFRSTGTFLGHWAEMTLVYWSMNSAERAVWADRPKGPRPL